jgi:cyclic-di-GMP-binding protein
MSIALSLPPIDAHPANPPEIRPGKVGAWLEDIGKRDATTAARLIGDALAATNRVAMSDSKRLDLAEKYWATATVLWPQLEKQFARASHPLGGNALEAAKAALTLATELATAYKHLLASEAGKRISLGGQRLMVALVHRCLQCTTRILVNCYLSYSPVPPRTWHDAHVIYAFARDRNIHLVPISPDQPEATPDRLTIQSLLLALANPYGFLPGQLPIVLRYVQEYAHWAKLTDVVPVHRMAKAVAIVPVGHDFPPFSANKGGSIEGSKLFLLTFDLAFQIQEQLRAIEAGGEVPAGVGRDPAARLQYLTLLKRLLRQWAIPPARQFNRLPSRARVVTCSGLAGVWQYSPGAHAGVNRPPSGLPPMANCQVINHTPAGYALRQTDSVPAALRIGELVALRIEGRNSLQIAMVRWFRNTLKGSGLEFGCELLSDNPEAAAAAAEGAAPGTLQPVVVLPEDTGNNADPAPPQVIVPAGVFQLEQAITLRRAKNQGFAVLTKLVEQGPGFELYEFVAVA